MLPSPSPTNGLLFINQRANSPNPIATSPKILSMWQATAMPREESVYLLFFFNEIRNYDNNCFLNYILFKNFIFISVKIIKKLKILLK
jgi:hypothetical protein